jgi:hypothetical protein
MVYLLLQDVKVVLHYYFPLLLQYLAHITYLQIFFQLVKVEDGLMSGEVMFHEYVHKTEEEKKAISKMRNQKL